ncbi:MAG: hypothetical protein ACK59R_07735 [Pseudomonadota bacterium]
MHRVPCFVVSCLALALAGAARADWPPSAPATIVLSAPDASGLGRATDLAAGGVPLARAAGVVDPTRLRLLDDGGAEVAAQFRVLARWNAGRDDASAPIQWVLVEAPAPTAGSGLRLRTDAPPGAPPAPAAPLSVVAAGGRYMIDTGAARFVVDPAAGTLFAEVRGADGSLIATGLPPRAEIDGATASVPATVRVARIDAQGPLSATLTVAWTLDMPPVGGGGLSLTRQYRFASGSPTALVRSALAWEGNRCPNAENLLCAAGVNGLRLLSLRDALRPAATGARSVQVLAESALAPFTANLGSGDAVHLRQLRRTARSAPLAYDLSMPGTFRPGATADGGALALSAGGRAIGVALARMDHHEPQALRVLGNGDVALDWVDAPGIWVGSRQAVHATLAVAARPATPTAGTLARRLWAPLAHPLRLWAQPAQYAASEAVPEFPVGPLPAAYAGFDAAAERMLSGTRSRFDALGLRGLMTSGLWPSDWGTPNDGPPDCGANDPTPADDWDDSYWCASWTDYHNTGILPVLSALRAGDPAWFDALAVPAALRMLHTQIMQCAPADPWFYCGQAPAGGGGYRANFNSSHGYFDNLVLYHFLTGDPWVTETLARGAASMRAYLCTSRAGAPPGPMCAPTAPGADDYVQINDRSASQWYEVFRLLGQTVDASYLDDWRGNIARWLSLHWAQGTDAQGRRLGFIVQSGVGNGLSILAPGAYTTSQVWMASGYDFEQLARLRVATQDAPLGVPALAPSMVMADWGRTLARTATMAPGNGSAAGIWPNTLDFAWSGARIGGAISGLAPGWSPGPMPSPCFDACLYDTGKSFTAAALARASDLADEPTLRALADDFARHAISRVAAADPPLGKQGGLFMARLPSAVARLAHAAAPPALFADGFE